MARTRRRPNDLSLVSGTFALEEGAQIAISAVVGDDVAVIGCHECVQAPQNVRVLNLLEESDFSEEEFFLVFLSYSVQVDHFDGY